MTAQLTTGKKAQFKTLLKQKEALLEKIHNIEESCEGIKNANNVSTTQKLNEEKSQLLQKQKDYTAELKVIGARLNEIGNQLNALSGTGSKKILDAIGKQEFYFIKNKPNVLFAKTTGLLWVNLDTFDFNNDRQQYGTAQAGNVRNYYAHNGLDGYSNWRFPSMSELAEFTKVESNPFHNGKQTLRLKSEYGWFCVSDNIICRFDIDSANNGVFSYSTISSNKAFLILCTPELVDNTDYAPQMGGKSLTDKEKAQ